MGRLRPCGWSRSTGCCAAMQRRLRLIGLLALACRGGHRKRCPATPTRNSQAPRDGDWIAYSTVPGDRLSGGGSDVFAVRQGRAPILIASREYGQPWKDRSWNVCPAFSPDGTMLAFGTRSPAGLSVSVVRMTRAGRRAHLEVRSGSVVHPVPLWSADSSRLAYVRGGNVIVRGLDGSSPRRRVGDPAIQDFGGRHADSFTSPTGDLVARRADSLLRGGRRAA